MTGLQLSTILAVVAMLMTEPAFTATTDTGNAQLVSPLNGVWLADRATSRLLENGKNEPPLLPAARQRYEATRARIKAGETAADPVNWCVSPGFPRIDTIATPFEITVRPDLVAIHYEWNRWARLVELQAELDVIDPGSMGEISGHWEGNTLVIKSKDFLETTYLDNSGLPHGAQLQIIERLQLKSVNQLEANYTITDPDTYSRPWSFTLTFRRQPNREIQEDACLDRLREGKPVINRGRGQ